jgi:hypothetical protein
MTRDFNKQRRNDPNTYQYRYQDSGHYSSFRSTPSNSEPSNRHGNARPLRSPRPRLNRETVDRAWREGAPHSHSDYHPRGTTNSHPQPRRGYQRSENSTSFNQPGNSNHRHFDRDNTRRFEQNPRNAQAPHSPSFPAGERPNSRRMPMNSAYPETRQPRFERNHARKWQHNEQFEGDYERFTEYDEVDEHRSNGYRQSPRAHQDTYRSNGYRQSPRARQNEAPARRHGPVTPLPDGRVVKGPRPAQRKNARFWDDIHSDADQLLHQGHEPQGQQSYPAHKSASPRQGKKYTSGSTTRGYQKNVDSAGMRGSKRPRTNSKRPAF